MGKSVTPQQLEDIIDSIVQDKPDVSGDAVIAGIRKQLGDNWSFTRTPPVKFTKDDINAVANGRFYRKTGMKLLMIFAISVLGIYILMGVLTSIPQPIWISLYGLVGIFFLYVYARKQRDARRELWKGIKGDGSQGEG